MDAQDQRNPVRNLGLLPTGRCVLAATDGHSRSGLLVDRVLWCADDPPALLVALPVGATVTPLILSSRRFTLSQLGAHERSVSRKFAIDPEPGDDPFDGFPHHSPLGGAPILSVAVAYYSCELIRHFDLDSDHEIMVGQVVTAKRQRQDVEPEILLGSESVWDETDA